MADDVISIKYGHADTEIVLVLGINLVLREENNG